MEYGTLLTKIEPWGIFKLSSGKHLSRVGCREMGGRNPGRRKNMCMMDCPFSVFILMYLSVWIPKESLLRK